MTRIRKLWYGAVGLVEREVAAFSRVIDRLDVALEHLRVELSDVYDERDALVVREHDLRSAEARARNVRSKLAALVGLE